MENIRKKRPRWLRSKSILFGGGLVAIIVLLGIFAPLVAPHDPLQQNLRYAYQKPTWEYPFGTDQFGRCLLSRVIYGARISLLEIVMGVSMAMAVGVPLGLAAGYFGGKVDRLIMWLLDIVYAFPALFWPFSS